MEDNPAAPDVIASPRSAGYTPVMTELIAPHYTGRRVAVGLSGGTDSAVAALLLKQAGADVVALTMHLVSDGHGLDAEPQLDRARRIAERLGVPHHVVDFTERFDQAIVQRFVDAYAAGQTPSPCCRCNPIVKFGFLLDAARSMGCDSLATGHYVRLLEDPAGERRIGRGLDSNKDQTYFLFGLTQRQLQCACFPLGGWYKARVKRLAADQALVVDAVSESQDLCFVKDDDYASLVACRRPDLAVPGTIVDREGNALGRHDGFFRYTIGQRQGLGLGGGPWYVTALRPERNEVVVGREEDLYSRSVRIGHLNWQAGGAIAESATDSDVQFRYRMKPVHVSRARMLDGGDVVVDLSTPVRGVAPGQAAVFYEEDCVLGGGWIKGTMNEK